MNSYKFEGREILKLQAKMIMETTKAQVGENADNVERQNSRYKLESETECHQVR